PQPAAPELPPPQHDRTGGAGDGGVTPDLPLQACHWIEDQAASVLSMNSELAAASDYWYCFSISRECKPGASSTAFDSSALDQSAFSKVYLEVGSELLEGGFVRRGVRYTR